MGERHAPSRAPGPPARRALARQVAQWRVFVPFYARALALQGSHPTIAAALVQHSSVFSDPLGRAARTTAYALRLLFGEDRAHDAASLRRMHRAIGGVGYDGAPYHAWDRDVWTWVHLSSAEALLYALDVMCGPLAMSDLEAFYEDIRHVGTLYGVADQDMPENVAGLRAYVERGVAELLVPNPGTDAIRAAVLAGDHVRALGLPGPLRALAGGVLAHPSRIVIFGAFPDAVRAQWGIRWGALHQGQYVGLVAALRAATEPLPDRVRMMPAAYRALHAA